MPRKYPKAEVGQVFGKWTVVGEAPRCKHGSRRVVCRCACGAEHVRGETYLTSGRSKECVKCSSRKNSIKGYTARIKYTTDALGYETSVGQAARQFGVSRKLAVQRAQRGSDPFVAARADVKINGEWVSYRQAALTVGVPPGTLYCRLRRGWTIHQALGIEPPPPRRRRK